MLGDATALLLPAPLPNHDALARVQAEWLALVVATAPAAAMGLIETQLKAQNSQGLMPVRSLGELLTQLNETDNPTVRTTSWMGPMSVGRGIIINRLLKKSPALNLERMPGSGLRSGSA